MQNVSDSDTASVRRPISETNQFGPSRANNPVYSPTGVNSPPGAPFSKAKYSGYTSPKSPTSPGLARIHSRGSVTSSRNYGCLTHVRMTASAKMSRFFKRLANFKQMDFEFAAWQMLFLLVTPQKVYRNFIYRKRTKDQWARDDPAFLVLLSAVLSLTSIIYALILGLSFIGFLKFFLWVVFIDCIFTGIIIASILWLVSNNCLRCEKEQDVEWAYCFDVHLNAFFPILIFLHFIMPILFPALISQAWFIARFLGNSLWMIALGYYLYITFLGYTALPFVKNTHVFLYPFTFLFIIYILTVTMGWNISQSVMWFYHYRVV